MILCLEIDARTKANLEELVHSGRYADFSEAVSVAIANQLLLHQHARQKGGSFIVPTDDALIEGSKKPLTSSVPTNESKIPLIFSTASELPEGTKLGALPSDSFVPGALVPVDRWIFGQHNKLLPVKASSRALASMTIDSRGIPLAKAASDIASQAVQLGDYLRELDDKHHFSRDEALAVAFPISQSDTTDKARLRYANQFVGAVNKQGQVSGLLADLKLVSLVPGKEPRIRLTEAGWNFAILENPILDGRARFTSKLGESEIRFLVEHIRSHVPAEDFAYRTILNACNEGTNTPEMLDEYLSKFISPRQSSPFTPAFISTQRSGAISRMSDLGLIARNRTGVKVTYVASESGGRYVSNNIARSA